MLQSIGKIICLFQKRLNRDSHFKYAWNSHWQTICVKQEESFRTHTANKINFLRA